MPTPRRAIVLLATLLTAFAGSALAAADQVGPFAVARKLLDPAAPDPREIAANGLTEDAVLLSGDSASGSIRTTQWSGMTQYGNRNWAATSLVGPAGKAYRLTWTPWSISEAMQLLSGEWAPYPKWMQDAHLRVAFLAGERDGFVVVDGVGFGLDNPFPAAAIVVELAFRNWQGGCAPYVIFDALCRENGWLIRRLLVDR